MFYALTLALLVACLLIGLFLSERKETRRLRWRLESVERDRDYYKEFIAAALGGSTSSTHSMSMLPAAHSTSVPFTRAA